MSNELNPNNPKKIIVDDDWKTRVQKEKETLAQSPEAQPAAAPPTKDEATHPPFPAPTFALLVSTLVTEALAGLGQIPGPDNQTPSVNLPHAKHFIDTLAILEEKTKGNLTREETAMLDNVLHELRMAFVAVSARR